jgi:hypothetical protein
MSEYMGGGIRTRNKRPEQSTAIARCCPWTIEERTMTQDREKISTGPNAEPVNETIAGTGPGIPDDALAPGEEELPNAPSDEQVEEAAEALGAPMAEKERDTLPLEGE